MQILSFSNNNVQVGVGALRNIPARQFYQLFTRHYLHLCITLPPYKTAIPKLFHFYRIYRSLTLFRWVLWVYTSDFTKITSYKIIKPGIYRLSNTILPCIHIYFIKEKYSIMTLNYNRWHLDSLPQIIFRTNHQIIFKMLNVEKSPKLNELWNRRQTTRLKTMMNHSDNG